MGDLVVDHGGFEGGLVGDVAVDEIDLGELRVVKEQLQPVRLAGQVVAPDLGALPQAGIWSPRRRCNPTRR